MLEEMGYALIADLLTKIGVKVATRTFNSRFLGSIDPNDTSVPDIDVESVMLDSMSDPSESPQFLTRQRIQHRVQLARAKWDWLIAATYYHPTLGRPGAFPKGWDPRSIGGQFTTADFAGRTLPHENDIGEGVPSEIRVRLIRGRINIAMALAESIDAIEQQIASKFGTFGFPEPLWAFEEISVPWNSLMIEVSRRRFADLPQLRSFCGFKDLFAVQDTPAAGIRPQQNYRPNVSAYAAAMELAWLLIQKDSTFGIQYAIQLAKKEAEEDRPASSMKQPHQYALRRVCVKMLKKIWQSLSSILGPGAPRRAAPRLP